MTLNQKLRAQKYKKKRLIKAPALLSCPQKKAICLKTFTVSPKKPNSARRKVAKVSIFSLKKELIVYLTGESHRLQQFGIVLLRGGRTQDVPGLRYKVIRGKYDMRGVDTRQTSRSKYGAKSTKNKVRVFFKRKKSQ